MPLYMSPLGPITPLDILYGHRPSAGERQYDQLAPHRFYQRNPRRRADQGRVRSGGGTTRFVDFHLDRHRLPKPARRGADGRAMPQMLPAADNPSVLYTHSRLTPSPVIITLCHAERGATRWRSIRHAPRCHRWPVNVRRHLARRRPGQRHSTRISRPEQCRILQPPSRGFVRQSDFCRRGHRSRCRLGPASSNSTAAGSRCQGPGSPHLFAAWFNLGAELTNAGDGPGAMLAYRNALAALGRISWPPR